MEEEGEEISVPLSEALNCVNRLIQLGLNLERKRWLIYFMKFRVFSEKEMID